MNKVDTLNLTPEQRKSIPDNILKVIYDHNDNVLFGSGYIKGKVQYNYLPKEYTVNGNPYIISTSISYDGKGNSDLPEDALIMHFKDLPSMFIDNIFR